MHLFFGRINVKAEPTDQFQNGYYHAQKGSSYYGDLNHLDFTIETVYVFMIAGDSIELWKVDGWRNDEQDLFFIKTGVVLGKNRRAWLAAFKYFYLDSDLIVFTTRRPNKKAFFSLKVDPKFTEADLLNFATYSNLDNYRYIELYDVKPSVISRNMIFFRENNAWHFLAPDFFDVTIEGRFIDNSKNINKGRPQKDKLLKMILESTPLPTKYYPDKLTLLNVYDIFFCEYNDRIEEEEIETENTKYVSPGSNEKIQGMTYNSILFGPPGTGKTFHSINCAVAIIEDKNIEFIIEEAERDRITVKKRFDGYLDDGSVIFTTFHQSLSYEDFIEGIKPVEPESEEDQLTYAVEDGIFKRLCMEAAFTYVKQQTNREIITKALDFSTAYDRLVELVNEKLSNGEPVEILTRSGGRLIIENITEKGNFRVRHNNREKYYVVSKSRLSKISQSFPNLTDLSNIDQQFRAVIGGSNATAYWAVLNAVRDQISSEESDNTTSDIDKEYSYEDKKEIIKSLKSEDYKVENSKKIVLVIDEINRGNVSQIFGELITLIEDDKRLGKEEALTVVLPYSKENFGVPPNVYIVGTMNTADRSVEALDTALRRRFSFIPKMPEASKLGVTTDGIYLSKILDTVNTRLRILKDNDHTIGHAWFWNVKDIHDLRVVYERKILPLLQEYFYNDYEKLGLVLGDAFFINHRQIDSSVFARFTGSNGLAGQYNQTWQYELKPSSQLDVNSFKTLETVSPIRTNANEGA